MVADLIVEMTVATDVVLSVVLKDVTTADAMTDAATTEKALATEKLHHAEEMLHQHVCFLHKAEAKACHQDNY